ncbi:MAG: hypothetical protein ABSE91_02770 [Patescibacteria group bacterium]|jgi:hypothetical protein
MEVIHQIVTQIVIMARENDGGESSFIAKILARSLLCCNIKVVAAGEPIPDLKGEDDILVLSTERLQTVNQAAEMVTATDGEILILEENNAFPVPGEVRTVITNIPKLHFGNVTRLTGTDLAETVLEQIAKIRQ